MGYKFFLSRLPRGISEWAWTVDRGIFKLIGADYGIHDLGVEVRIRALKEQRYLRVWLSIQGWVEVPCDRGQELIRLPIEAQHEQIYSWDEHYLPPSDTEEFFALSPREDEIDLTQALYDFIALAIPRRRIRPTCPDANCPSYIRTYLALE